jgi:hypothetical protein
MIADEKVNRYAIETLNRADALLFGRVTYELIAAGSRRPAPANVPEAVSDRASGVRSKGERPPTSAPHTGDETRCSTWFP